MIHLPKKTLDTDASRLAIGRMHGLESHSENAILKYIFNDLIRVFQNNSIHSTLNRVKYKKQILLPVGFEPTTSCIHSKSLPARLQGLHGGNRTHQDIEIL